MELKREWVDKYDDSLARHLMYYREAAYRVGVDPSLIAIHDESKNSIDEYPYYVRKFGGGIDEPGFELAWLNHIHQNPHHPEHWIMPGEPNTVLEMPEEYVREMVADWMGSSKAYTGSFDMTEWLKDNLSKKVLHKNSFSYLVKVLVELGYSKSDLMAWSLKSG